MKNLRALFQVVIGGLTSVLGGFYVADLAQCKDCDLSVAENIGLLAIILSVGFAIAFFWAWMFLPELSVEEDEEEKESK